jgi:hypothetical protein
MRFRREVSYDLKTTILGLIKKVAINVEYRTLQRSLSILRSTLIWQNPYFTIVKPNTLQ